MRNFSRYGASPTVFEERLFDRPDVSHLTDARQVWVDLARTIGVRSLFHVLDRLGTGKVHVPTRQDLVIALWRQARNAEIRAKLAAGAAPADVAAEYEMTTRNVRMIRDGTAPDAKAVEKW